MVALPAPPAPDDPQDDALAPALAIDGADLLLTWSERAREGSGRPHRVRMSRLPTGRAEEAWTPPSIVAAGDRLFVNWADFAAVVPVGPPGPASRLLAHWRQRDPAGGGAYAYGVRLAASADGGRTFTPLGSPHAEDSTATEHGFVAVAADGGGARIWWLDGRATAANGPMALRTAPVGDSIGTSVVVDDRVCDCCGLAAVPGRVAYRDRSGAEVRDVRVAAAPGPSGPPLPGDGRLVAADGWTVEGCPVNGPGLARTPSGRLWAAWYTQGAGGPQVRAAASDDGGDAFGPPVQVAGPSALGRVDLAVAPATGDALVLWLEGGSDAPGHDATLRLRRVAADGAAGAPLAVAPTQSARASGFPRMVRRGDDLVVAWTDPGPPSRIRLARVPLADIPADGPAQARVPGPDPARAVDAPPPGVGDLAGPTLAGGTLRIADLRGDAVLINVWASWCEPCRRELPALAAVHRALPPGVRLVGLSLDAAVADARAAAASASVPYPTLHAPDAEPVVARALAPAGSATAPALTLPITLVVDRAGRLAGRVEGPLAGPADPRLRALLRPLGVDLAAPP